MLRSCSCSTYPTSTLCEGDGEGEMRCDVRSGPPGGENRDSRVKEGAQRGESEWEGKGRNARQKWDA